MGYLDKINDLELANSIPECLKEFDVYPATLEELPQVHRMATLLIGANLARLDAVVSVHERTGIGIFVAKSAGVLTGLIGFVPLSRLGLEAVTERAFDALDPDPEHVASRDQTPFAMYGWAIAAADKETARRVVGGARAVIRGAAGHLPFFARPTTDAGDRLMRERLAFVDTPGLSDGMVWAPAARLLEEVAA